MDDPRNSIFDVQSGINALCVYLADVVQNGSSDVRDKLIDLLHKLVSGEATSTIFADFSVPGQKSRIFLIADSEEQQMKLLREFEAQLEQQMPPSRRRKTASAIVIPFPSQTATEEPV